MSGMVDIGPAWDGGHGGPEDDQAAVGHDGHLHPRDDGEVHVAARPGGPAADHITRGSDRTPGPEWIRCGQSGLRSTAEAPQCRPGERQGVRRRC